MFTFSTEPQHCPPDSLFCTEHQRDFTLARPQNHQHFIALWHKACGVSSAKHKVVCCGSPYFTQPSAEELSISPCLLLAQSILSLLQTHTPENALLQGLKNTLGSFTLLIWSAKNNVKTLYTKGLQCFTDSMHLETVSTAPYTLPLRQLWSLPFETVVSSEQPFLETHVQRFQSIDPLQSLETAPFERTQTTFDEKPAKITILAEDISLCVGRMLKDHLEHTQNIAVDIFPLAAHISTLPEQSTHPVFILPNLFSEHTQTLELYKTWSNVAILQQNKELLADIFNAPLLHPLQQWVTLLQMLDPPAAPQRLETHTISETMHHLAPFIPQLQKTSRLYLGRHTCAAFARICAFYDLAVTQSNAMHYPSGELKHGPLALVDTDLTALIFCPYNASFHKNVNNMKEILARNGHILAFTDINGAECLRSEGIDHIALSTSSESVFLTRAWIVIHRLMFLLEV